MNLTASSRNCGKAGWYRHVNRIFESEVVEFKPYGSLILKPNDREDNRDLDRSIFSTVAIAYCGLSDRTQPGAGYSIARPMHSGEPV